MVGLYLREKKHENLEMVSIDNYFLDFSSKWKHVAAGGPKQYFFRDGVITLCYYDDGNCT